MDVFEQHREMQSAINKIQELVDMARESGLPINNSMIVESCIGTLHQINDLVVQQQAEVRYVTQPDGSVIEQMKLKAESDDKWV